MKNSDKILDQEIGAMGAEPSLGRLQRPESYGQKSGLSETEREDARAFMSRARQASEDRASNIEDGWIPILRQDMGIREKFYPADWEFYIHPATVQAIKNWTAIDEERPDQVNRVFNEIIKSCVRIKTGNSAAPWGSLNSWDRFWFILKVREYTFAKGETKIEFQDECSECGADLTFNLGSDSLYYEFPDEELIDKYWDGSQWNISPREYGVLHDDIVLYTPQLSKDEAIIEWATAQAHAKQKLDEVFLRFLPWMLQKAPKDPNVLDKLIQRCRAEYKSWDADMFDFMDEVVRNITINPSEKLKMKCPHCGAEAVSSVQFPNGVKSLFKVHTDRKRFGSR